MDDHLICKIYKSRSMKIWTTSGVDNPAKTINVSGMKEAWYYYYGAYNGKYSVRNAFVEHIL